MRSNAGESRRSTRFHLLARVTPGNRAGPAPPDWRSGSKYPRGSQRGQRRRPVYPAELAKLPGSIAGFGGAAEPIRDRLARLSAPTDPAGSTKWESRCVPGTSHGRRTRASSVRERQSTCLKRRARPPISGRWTAVIGSQVAPESPDRDPDPGVQDTWSGFRLQSRNCGDRHVRSRPTRVSFNGHVQNCPRIQARSRLATEIKQRSQIVGATCDAVVCQEKSSARCEGITHRFDPGQSVESGCLAVERLDTPAALAIRGDR